MATLQRHEALVSWVLRNEGFLHQDVEVAHTPEKGFHVVVRMTKSISSLTRIASCPMSATLSVLNAMDVPPFRCHGTRFPPAFLRQQPHVVVQSFFLMEQ